MDREYENEIQKYESIYEKIKQSDDIIDIEYMESVKQFSKNIRSKIENCIKCDRLLRIGIVGEVKAGKSTFINSVVFDGENILPQAATPMTAALTKISYSENIKAEVEFYNREDWSTIEEYAKLYEKRFYELKNEFIELKKKQNISPFKKKHNQENSMDIKINETELKAYIRERVSKESKGCYELVSLFNNSRFELEQYLDKGKIILDNVNDLSDLMGKLEEYVGANGQYTPIVKSTSLYLNIDILKDLEIIDTPGTNDPIVSRTMATEKYLSNCDVVFLLSYSGQFMKAQDVQFLANTLPSEGIKNGIIIGSKFDSALLDDNNSGNDFMKSLKITSTKLSKHATDIIDDELRRNPDNSTLLSLKKSMPPQYVSPMSYIIYKKNKQDLSEQEAHILGRLEKRFKDFKFSADMLRGFSNIDRIRKTYIKDIRENKEVILKGKLADVLVGQRKKVRNLILDIEKDTNIKLDTLLNSDKKQLDLQLQELKNQSRRLESKVVTIFDNEVVEIKKLVRKLQIDIKSRYLDYDKLEVKKDVSTSTSTSRGGFLYLKKTVNTTTTTDYKVNIKEAVNNVRMYAIDIQSCALKDFENIVNIKSIKDNLRKTIVNEIDFSDSNFDEEYMLAIINNELKKLTIPELKINIEEYEKMIANSFSGTIITNEDIHLLEAKQRDVLVKISDDVEKKLECILSNIEKKFLDQSIKFISNLEINFEKSIGIIKTQLNDKETYKNKYEKLNEVIEEIKKSL